MTYMTFATLLQQWAPPLIRWQSVTGMVGIASTFAFLSVFWWSLQRRREREAFYRYELTRRLIEQPETKEGALVEWLRETEQSDARRRRDSLLLTAFALAGSGGGALVAMQRKLFHDDAIGPWTCVGAGIALFVYLLLTKAQGAGRRGQ
jgi:hypothetical protein